MKFTENSLVVDVVKISNSSFKLSVPAGDLMTAAMNGAVLRRHDLSTAAVPNVLYVPLSEAKLSSGTYTFTFASGDKFTASSADAYPAASSVSDETGGGSGGGGVLVVHATPSDDATTLDKTWQQIHDADAVSIVFDIAEENARNFFFCSSVFERVSFGGGDTQYVVKVHDFGDSQIMEFIASSESDYPSYTYE